MITKLRDAEDRPDLNMHGLNRAWVISQGIGEPRQDGEAGVVRAGEDWLRQCSMPQA
jgi:hypothetical protein